MNLPQNKEDKLIDLETYNPNIKMKYSNREIIPHPIAIYCYFFFFFYLHYFQFFGY